MSDVLQRIREFKGKTVSRMAWGLFCNSRLHLLPLAQTIFEACGAGTSKSGHVTKAAEVMRATREAHAVAVHRAKRKEQEGLDSSWTRQALRKETVFAEEAEVRRK